MHCRRGIEKFRDSRAWTRGIYLILTLGLVACSATPKRPSMQNSRSAKSQDGGVNKSPDGSDSSSLILSGESPLRRLTNYEYLNTVGAMVGDVSNLKLDFSKESASSMYPFTNRASAQVVPTALARQYLNAAELIASDTIQNRLATVLPCKPETGEEACAVTFISAIGAKAFRRDLTPEQSGALLAIYKAGRKQADFNTGLEWALAAILQMPEFLYRIEEGSEKTAPQLAKIDSYDMAARLSYFLWSTSPDEDLLKAAKADTLKTPVQIAAAVDRMIKDPKAKAMITHFHDQWFGMESIEEKDRDPTTFRGFSPAVALAMRDEVRNFVSDVIWKGDGKIETLLTSPFTYMNDTLGDFYGIKGLSSTFDKIDASKLGSRPVSGLLTMGAVITMRDARYTTSPTLRGAFIRNSLLCRTLPAPPPDAVFTLPMQMENQTRRQLVEAHSKNTACVGCHKLMDPIGLAFENFDAAGRFREKEGNQAIDATGELFDTDVDGKFVGPAELSAKLAASPIVTKCFATHWFQYAFGRDPGPNDETELIKLSAALGSGGTLSGIRYITQMPQFLNRSLASGVSP